MHALHGVCLLILMLGSEMSQRWEMVVICGCCQTGHVIQRLLGRQQALTAAIWLFLIPSLSFRKYRERHFRPDAQRAAELRTFSVYIGKCVCI